jgi:cellulose synthase/poly-beta-1,6-N-acetylglucosamine synthase-like glycosyltransferase
VIAVIDSDYGRADLAARSRAGVRQSAQSRSCRRRRTIATATRTLFKAMCYAEYRGFFHIGMVTRNERNAIIQHGTMTMVRRACSRTVALGRVVHHRGCRARPAIFEAGYERATTARSYGRGLMPDTFLDYKKQRFRWAYGAMQILKSHAGCSSPVGGRAR